MGRKRKIGSDRVYDLGLDSQLQDIYLQLRTMSRQSDKTAYKKAVSSYRKQYSKMLSTANKRLERGLKSKEFGHDVVFTNAVRDPFKGLTSIKRNNLKQLIYEIGKVEKFLNAGTTIKERREKREQVIEQFHENGYEFVNKKNYKNVTAFLNAYREAVGSRMYDSDRALSYYEENAKRFNKMSPEGVYSAFKRYLETGGES